MVIVSVVCKIISRTWVFTIFMLEWIKDVYAYIQLLNITINPDFTSLKMWLLIQVEQLFPLLHLKALMTPICAHYLVGVALVPYPATQFFKQTSKSWYQSTFENIHFTNYTKRVHLDRKAQYNSFASLQHKAERFSYKWSYSPYLYGIQ
jgi:hypothetical protein